MKGWKIAMEITFSLFPKFYKHLSPRQLAALVREVGLDTTNVVIREGYWVTHERLAEELPAFMKAMREEGLDVRFATADLPSERLLADPTPLRILADNGVREFRLAYFHVRDGDPRASLVWAREQLERLAPICESHGIRAVYQLHAGTLITNPSAAWHIVNGLPSQWIGVEIDPGNQANEGFENWNRSALLLREYIVAAGIKDVVIIRNDAHADDPDKGWRKSLAPLYEGVTNWYDFMRALAAIDFAGTFVFMPFYDENDPETMTKKLKREVEYLRNIVAAVTSES